MEFNIKKNIGFLGRAIRTFAGAVLVVLILTGTLSGFWAIIGGIAALILFVEAYFSYCFVVDLLGWPKFGERNK